MVYDNNEHNSKDEDDSQDNKTDLQKNQDYTNHKESGTDSEYSDETPDPFLRKYTDSPQQESEQNKHNDYYSEKTIQNDSDQDSVGSHSSIKENSGKDDEDTDLTKNELDRHEDSQDQDNKTYTGDVEINRFSHSTNNDFFSPASLPHYRWDSSDLEVPPSTPSVPGDEDSGRWKKVVAIAIAIILPAGIAAVGFLGVGSYVGDDSSLSDPGASVKGGGIPPGYDDDGANPQGKYRYEIPPGVGKVGEDHAHAAIRTVIDGSYVDFGMPRFQLKSEYIHFENQNPYLIHRHATGVPLSVLFESVNIEVKDSQACFVVYASSMKANKKQFCQDSDHVLRFYVNDKEVSSISDYVIEHGDRILIFYGKQNQALNKEIKEQLESLNSLEIYDVPKDKQKDENNDKRGIEMGKDEILV